ncbi:MAG: lysophospholipid acyltransferase family protein [Armatimonadota bacterium]
MKDIWKKLRTEIIWRLLWLVSTGIACTVRIKPVGIDRLEDMRSSGHGGVIATWHGTTILPIYFCRHMGFWAIVSVSKDGELQSRLLQSRGYRIVHGSSRAHGAKALLESVKRIKDDGIITITPDGPRGPAKVVQPGIVLMAERSGCSILPVGIACSRVWQFNSWDKHEVPKPFSKACIVFGDPIHVGKCETDEDRTKWSEMIGKAISAADERAAEELFGKGKQDADCL